jgi:hypothetical protein
LKNASEVKPIEPQRGLRAAQSPVGEDAQTLPSIDVLLANVTDTLGTSQSKTKKMRKSAEQSSL